MYTIVGLKESGKMVLYSYSDGPPNLVDLANELEDFDYTQVLIIRSGEQIARYEYSTMPRLKKVELV